MGGGCVDETSERALCCTSLPTPIHSTTTTRTNTPRSHLVDAQNTSDSPLPRTAMPHTHHAPLFSPCSRGVHCQAGPASGAASAWREQSGGGAARTTHARRCTSVGGLGVGRRCGGDVQGGRKRACAPPHGHSANTPHQPLWSRSSPPTAGSQTSRRPLPGSGAPPLAALLFHKWAGGESTCVGSHVRLGALGCGWCQQQQQ